MEEKDTVIEERIEIGEKEDMEEEEKDIKDTGDREFK